MSANAAWLREFAAKNDQLWPGSATSKKLIEIASELGVSLHERLKLSADNRKLLVEWLKEMANDARTHDPDVGIFGNEDLAEALETIASEVE